MGKELLVAVGVLAGKDLIKEIYTDLASPSIKIIGKTLASIVEVTTSGVFYPVHLANGKIQARLAVNLQKYTEKIKAVPEDKLIEVPTEIAQPIIEAFTYVTNEELANAFVNLLVHSSNIDTANIVHPSFVNTIKALSPDEALILMHLGKSPAFKYMKTTWITLEMAGLDSAKYPSYFTGIEQEIKLIFPTTIGLYFENMERLGLVKIVHGNPTGSSDASAPTPTNTVDIQKKYHDVFNGINSHFTDISKEPGFKSKGGIFSHGKIYISEYGRLFCKACKLYE